MVPTRPEKERNLHGNLHYLRREIEHQPPYINPMRIPPKPNVGVKKKTSMSVDLVQENMDEGTKALLSHTVRDAIYDIRPHPERLRVKPYMYWNPDKKRPA